MQSSKKTKEDTWTEKELLKAIQKDGGHKRRSDGEKGERKHRSSEKEKKSRVKKDDGTSSKGKEARYVLTDLALEKKSKHRDKERDGVEEREKNREQDKHREKKREKDKHRDKDRDKEKDRHRDKEKDKHRDKDRDKDRDKRDKDRDKRDKDRDKKDKDRDKRDKDRDINKHEDVDEYRDKDRHQERDGEKRRSKERHRERDKDKHRDNQGDENKDKSRDRRGKSKDRDKDRRRSDRGDGGENSKRSKHKSLNENKSVENVDEVESYERKSKERISSRDKQRKSSKEDKENYDLKESNDQGYFIKEGKKRSKHRIVDNESTEKILEENDGKLGSAVDDRRKESKDDIVKLEKSSHSSEVSTQEVNEAENAYDYDDDFNDYDDDDFEDEDSDDGHVDNDSYNDSDYNSEIEEDQSSGNPMFLTEMENKFSVKTNVVKTEGSALHYNSREETNMQDLLGVSEVVKAIFEENEKISSETNSRNSSRPSTGNETSGKGNEGSLLKKVVGKINFVAASKKQVNEKVARKTRKRGQELLKLIQLDRRAIELFDMPPMTEYELYMKRFGQSGYTQMFSQTHDDDVTANTQTEDIETSSRWCQCSHDIKTCGTNIDNESDPEKTISGSMNVNTVRLNKFLHKAAQVFISLFSEIEAGIEQPQKLYTESKTAFSEGYVTLGSSDVVTLGRDFFHVAYSPSQTNMLLAAYGEIHQENKKDQKLPAGLISVWNTNEPTRATCYLVCESVPKSCCFSSTNPSMIFAGMEDGVVSVWDLREPASYHKESLVDNVTQLFRTATYTTAALQENHQFPIVAVTPITSNSPGGVVRNHDGDVDMSFQLISLDQSGVLNIWIVVEVLGELSDMSSVNDDFGLSARGRMKLAKSAMIQPLSSSLSSMYPLLCATCVQVDLCRPNHLYIGTDQGKLIHSLRFGNKPIPKIFKLSKGGISKINAIDASPWKMPYFLVCYDNGSISLFSNRKEMPVCTWDSFSDGISIIDVMWSRSKPNLFFAIDIQSVFYIWDLFESDMEPIFKQEMKRKDKQAIGFSLANDYTSLGIGSPGRAAEMVLTYSDGSIEVHRLSKNLSHMSGDELDRLRDYLDNIITT